MRIGIVGAGTIARSHAQAIARIADAELAAVCDHNPEQLRAFAGEFGVVDTYSDYQAMLRRDDIDLIHICLPSGLHAPFAIEAAEASKHILTEKPMEITTAKMDAMIRAAQTRQVKLGVVYQRRTLPAAAAIRETVRSGALGKLVLGDVYMKYHRTQAYYDSAGWRGTWALDGGGALMNQGIHGIDLLQWMMGDIASVYARSAALVRDIEVEDTAVAVIRYRSGALGVIQGATSVYPAQDTRFELHGERGTIILDDSGIKKWDMMDDAAPRPENLDGMGNLSDIILHGHTHIIEDMIRAIREDREPMVGGEEAKKAVNVILAIYESAREGKEVLLT